MSASQIMFITKKNLFNRFYPSKTKRHSIEMSIV